MVNIYQNIQNPIIVNGKAESMTMTTGTITGIVASSITVNSKITVPNGSASTDAAAYGQIKYFQAVQATYTGSFTTTNSAYQATGFTVSITPSSASHRIKIIVNNILQISSTNQAGVTIYRNGSDILSGTVWGFERLNSAGGTIETTTGYEYIDSPATTSAVTYELRLRASGGTAQIGDTTICLIAEEIL